MHAPRHATPDGWCPHLARHLPPGLPLPNVAALRAQHRGTSTEMKWQRAHSFAMVWALRVRITV